MAGARSIVNQNLYLQREATPGTAATNSMRRYLGMKATNVGWEIQRERFKAAGFKIDTGHNTTTEMGAMDVEVMQDYNAFMPLLAGVFGAPATTELEDGVAYQHVFQLNPTAADLLTTFTAIYGDPVQALMATYLAFHGMTLGVEPQQLSLSATALLRAPTTGASVPDEAAVEDVPMIPVRASTYCAYLDDSWASLGTTQLLALYSAQLRASDKLVPDWVINCHLDSFSEVLESDTLDWGLDLTLGFDSTAVAQIEDAKNGELKFVRIESIGPEIDGTEEGTKHQLMVDTSVVLTPGRVARYSATPAVVQAFTGHLEVDPTSGNVAQVTLINGLESL